MGQRPLIRLALHFLDRLVRGGKDADSELELGAGPLLGLLAAPGAFSSLVLFDKYSGVRDYIMRTVHHDIYTYSIPDKYFFICLAMTVTGIVTALKWDKILPDSQDYLNLAPLPLAPRKILLANAVAIAAAVLVFAVDVNVSSAVLFPTVVSAYSHLGLIEMGAFMVAHATVMIMASLFAFCAIFALLGVLSAVLPREAFRACSAWVRGAVLVGSMALLFTVSAGPGLLRGLEHAPDSPARYLPTMWFLGLYQTLHHRVTPAIAGLTRSALLGFAAAFTLMVASYGFSYRRRFASVLESSRRTSRQHVAPAGLAFLDLFASRAASFDRACHRFIVRAMLRDETHRLCIATAAGLGWLLGIQSVASDAESTRLAAQLAAAYVLILGLRIAFEVPAGVPSNWIFRSTLNARANETPAVARRVMLAFMVPLVTVPAFAVASWQLGPLKALVHCLYGLALSMCLGELFLAGYRKIPLTSPMPGFRENLLAMVVIQIVGFAAFTLLGARMELLMFETPWLFALLPAAMGGAWLWNRRRIAAAREAGEWDEGLTFDSAPPATVERLDLFDAR